MRTTLGVALALALLSGPALAQGGGGGGGGAGGAGGGAGGATAGAPSAMTTGSATTTGQATTDGMGGGMQRAPIGHVQPRTSDFPAGYLDGIGKRSPEEETLDRKLNICRTC